MYHSIFNVFVILLLTWSSPVSSQTPLQAAISSLNDCANSCIATSSKFVGCGATDFGCQCAKQDAIIGPDRRVSIQGACILKACGPSSATDVRSTFNKICGLQAASSAVGIPAGQAPAPAPAPASTQVDTPTTTPISILTPNLPAAATSVVNLPVPQPTGTQAPASFIPVTQSIPILPAPTPENTFSIPLLESATTSISIPAISTPPPSSFPSSASPSSSPSAETIPSPQEQQPSSFPDTSSPSPSPSSPSPSPLNTTPLPSTSSNRTLPPLAIAGIILLILGFVSTLLSFTFLTLRRRRRRRRSYLNPEEKMRPETADSWIPFQSSTREKARVVMGVENGPRAMDMDMGMGIGMDGERPKSRGKGGGGGGSGTVPPPPPQFPMLGMGMGMGMRRGGTSSPLGSGGVRRVGTGGGGAGGMPLKSAMKKSRESERERERGRERERPKSRPLIRGGKGDKDFMFGFDPLGSNPRSPTM